MKNINEAINKNAEISNNRNNIESQAEVKSKIREKLLSDDSFARNNIKAILELDPGYQKQFGAGRSRDQMNLTLEERKQITSIVEDITNVTEIEMVKMVELFREIIKQKPVSKDEIINNESDNLDKKFKQNYKDTE